MDITATTAIPDAVLTGFVFKIGKSFSLWVSGKAATKSTNFGIEQSYFFLDIFDIIFFISLTDKFYPLSYASIIMCKVSVITCNF